VGAVRLALERGAALLQEAEVGSPRHDAEALLAHVLGCTRADLLTLREVPPDAEAAYGSLLLRRAGREPLQHLVGSAAFRHVEVAVGPGVFIPRPETELVAGAAIAEALAVGAAGGRPVVVDLCAGSGAIALAVADEAPLAEVHAVERSAAACEWLARNAAGSRVHVHRADAATALPGLDGSVDVVVSNPPYVPESDRPRMDPETLRHDPPEALWGGGSDGLEVPGVVISAAARLLRPGGLLALEHAEGQGAGVRVLLGSGPWTEVATHRDLAGRERFATARR
jgi:release factor glutamine methyltransferase